MPLLQLALPNLLPATGVTAEGLAQRLDALFDDEQRVKLGAYAELDSAVWVTDVQAAEVVWANPRGLQIWRADTMVELADRDWSTNTPAAKRRVAAAWTRASLQGRTRGRRTFYPSGEPVLVETALTAWRLRDGRRALLVEGRECGKRDRKALTERPADALHYSPYPVAMFGSQGEMLFANPAFEATFPARGEPRDLGLAPAAWKDLLAACRTNERVRLEHQLSTATGLRHFVVQADPAVDPMTGSRTVVISAAETTEFQEQRRRERRATLELRRFTEELERRVDVRTAALKAAEARYRSLYDAAPDMMASVDPQTAQLKECNQAVVDRLGYSREELLNRSIFELYHPDCLEAVREAFDAFATTGEVRDAELQLKRKDGTKIEVSLNVSSVRDEQGAIVASSSIWRDITEQKQTEVALARLNKELEERIEQRTTALRKSRERATRAERLAAIGQLAAGVAHEINNPASSIILNDEIIRDRAQTLLEQAGHGHDMLEEIETLAGQNLDAVARVRAIVKSLSAFARTQDASTEAVQVNEIVRDACEIVRNEIRYRGRLVLDLADLPEIVAVRTKLVQMMVNLLVNGVHALGEDRPEDNLISVSTRRDEFSIWITVEDTGCGIAPDVVEHVLDPFFTTKGSRGTGLGLAIVADVVQLHGGEITVKSTPGKGTCFAIRVPTQTGLELLVTQREPSPRHRPAGARARILVVDDDAAVRDAFRRVLERHHEVTVADSGDEGLAEIARGTPFDVILCDLMMPEVDGPRFYAAVRATDPALACRIMFCSGGAVTDGVREFVSSMPNRLLEKPATRAELLDAVEVMLSHDPQTPPRK